MWFIVHKAGSSGIFCHFKSSWLWPHWVFIEDLTVDMARRMAGFVSVVEVDKLSSASVLEHGHFYVLTTSISSNAATQSLLTYACIRVVNVIFPAATMNA